MFNALGKRRNQRDEPNMLILKDNGETLTVGDLEEFAEQFVANFDKKLNALKKEIQDWKLRLTNHSVNGNDIMTYDDFITKYSKYNFPFKNACDFQIFILDLEYNVDDLKTNFMKLLQVIMSHRTNLIENIKIVIQKFFKKSVLHNYTAQKHKQDKKLFKETQFYKCLYDSLAIGFRKVHEEIISEKEVLSAIGTSVFNFLKDSRKRKFSQLTDN